MILYKTEYKSAREFLAQEGAVLEKPQPAHIAAIKDRYKSVGLEVPDREFKLAAIPWGALTGFAPTSGDTVILRDDYLLLDLVLSVKTVGSKTVVSAIVSEGKSTEFGFHSFNVSR